MKRTNFPNFASISLCSAFIEFENSSKIVARSLSHIFVSMSGLVFVSGEIFVSQATMRSGRYTSYSFVMKAFSFRDFVFFCLSVQQHNYKENLSSESHSCGTQGR